MLTKIGLFLWWQLSQIVLHKGLSVNYVVKIVCGVLCYNM